MLVVTTSLTKLSRISLNESLWPVWPALVHTLTKYGCLPLLRCWEPFCSIKFNLVVISNSGRSSYISFCHFYNFSEKIFLKVGDIKAIIFQLQEVNLPCLKAWEPGSVWCKATRSSSCRCKMSATAFLKGYREVSYSTIFSSWRDSGIGELWPSCSWNRKSWKVWLICPCYRYLAQNRESAYNVFSRPSPISNTLVSYENTCL